MIVKVLDRRVMRLASVGSAGSFLCNMYARKGLVQVGSVATVEHGVPLMMPKWDQHPRPTKEASKTQSQDWRWATPSPHEDVQGTPEPRKGSGWPPGPTSLWGIAQDKEAPGFRGPAGGRTTPGGLIRTEEDKNANTGGRRPKTSAPRRRTGSWSWSVGVSVHYLHLSLHFLWVVLGGLLSL